MMEKATIQKAQNHSWCFKTKRMTRLKPKEMRIRARLPLWTIQRRKSCRS